MMIIDKDWLIATYEDVVSQSGDEGMGNDDVRTEVARRYEAAVTGGELPPPDINLIDLGLMRFDKVIAKERRKRGVKLRDDIKFLADTLFTAEAGDVDPILALAVPLGDGRDKTLRFWSADDWMAATTIRYRNAAKVTAAAAAFDETSQRIRSAMRARDVQRTEDLFRA